MWEYDDGSTLKLKYTFESILEFYRMALNVSPTGNETKHLNMRTLPNKGNGWSRQSHEERLKWIGNLKSLDELYERRFAWKEKVDEIEKNTQAMVQGYRKRIYKYDELDGDDINMERLYEHLPAMIKRVHVTGDKFGNFISLYFNAGVDGGVSASAIMHKTMAASKLATFFESLNKRVEIILYFKSVSPGKYKGERIKHFTLEVVVKPFNLPLNIALINSVMAPWFMRYWILMFMNTRMDTESGHGRPGILTEDDLKKHKGNRIILVDGYDCLTEEKSKLFIENVLANEKTSVVQE